jgi:hypothetical protein
LSLRDFPVVAFFVLILLTVALTEIGLRVSRRTHANDDGDCHDQITGLRDSLLVFLGLLLGFTYSMAITRYEARRELAVQEANAIGTTVLRADFLPPSLSSQALELLRQYIKVRVDFGQYMPGTSEMNAAVARSGQIQQQLWQIATQAVAQDRTAVTVSFIQTLNETIDLSETRLAAQENRVPRTIWLLIVSISLATAFTSGYSLKRRFWFTSLLLPLILALAMSLIADLDSPTRGLIRVGDASLHRLQDGMEK